MMKIDFEQKIFNTIKRNNLLPQSLPEPVNIVVALSGGADSMCLLYFLEKHKKELNITLEAAHINHNIRGEEAKSDEFFVRNYCADKSIKLTVFDENIPLLAAQSGESEELTGRKIRYERLYSIDDTSLIATAHNLDDSAETALINMIRGTGLKGLCGITPKRERIIRPLIDCEKSEIISFCKINNIPFVTDSTNFESKYTRNKLRNLVFPVFQQINPSFLTSFSRMAQILGGYENFLDETTSEIVSNAKIQTGYSVSEFLRVPAGLLSRVISHAVFELSGELCEASHSNEIIEKLECGGSINITNSKIIRSDGKTLFLFKPEMKNEYSSFKIKCPKPEGKIFFNNKTIEMQIKTEKFENILQNVNNPLFTNLLDYDTISGNICIRTRTDGDKIRLKSRGCTKTLKNLFNEKKLTAAERAGRIILADDEGIVFVEGFSVCERCAVSEKTQKYIEINIT